MVDFDDGATIGTPAVDVVRILILQRRYDLFEAWEQYKKQNHQGVDSDISVVRARLNTFFLELQAMLERKLNKKDYAELYKKVNSKKEEEILEAIKLLNQQLDKLQLTKIDTRRVYDSTRVEKENKSKGL